MHFGVTVIFESELELPIVFDRAIGQNLESGPTFDHMNEMSLHWHYVGRVPGNRLYR